MTPAEPRPNDHPIYIDPNCDICNTPLVLADVFHNPYIKDSKVWHDEWICPKHPEEGVYMDWPQEQLDELKRLAELSESLKPEDMIELGDFRDEGGMRVVVHPEIFKQMMEDPTIPLEEVMEEFRGMKPENNDQ